MDNTKLAFIVTCAELASLEAKRKHLWLQAQRYPNSAELACLLEAVSSQEQAARETVRMMEKWVGED